MDSAVPFIILIAAFFLVAVPILAIVAFVRSGRAQQAQGEVPHLISRVYDLEQRLNAIEKRIASLAFNVTAGPATTVAPSAPPPAAPYPTIPSPPLTPMAGAPPETPRGEAQIRPTPHVTPLATPPSAATTPSAGTHQAPPSSRPAAPPPPPPIPPRAGSSPLSIPPSSRKNSEDVEEVIAGRWLNYVGILALALAVSFFLKYAFDNNWIGPGGRVTLGLIAGSLLYPLGQRLFNKGYEFYSEGITALGAAILYLSVWAGWHYYHLFAQSSAFPMMIVITAVTAIVAVMRNSERLAFLAAVGGLLTPILVSTGQNAETVLFGYLVILGAGMLGISWRKDWKSLPPLQFIATVVYFWSWYADFYTKNELNETVAFATLFFALFAVLPFIRSSRQGQMGAEEIGMVLLNATQILVALRQMLWPEDRWGLTFFLVGLAVVHLAAERAVPRNQARASTVARMLYAGLALTFLTLTIPIRLEGKWITIAWAVEGAVMVWSGLRIRSRALRSAGLALFLLVLIRLIAYPIHAEPEFLLNSRFLTMAICAASYLAAFIFAAQSDEELEAGETQIYMALGGAANLLFLVGLSLDVWDLYGRMPSLGIDRSLAQQLALSILWLVYASVLMAAGAKWKSALLRWQALLLLGVVIVKVFFFDLSFLTRFYRILSFFLLGLVLLVISFAYQRRTRASSGGTSS
jgi:uncharacterized membrane protein